MASAPSPSSPGAVTRSEDILSEKTDICLANAVVKAGIGLGGGVIASVILFRRRAFPVWLGIGGGLGAAYSDCQRVFNPVAIPGYRVLGPEEAKGSSSSAPSPPAGSDKGKRLL